MTTLKVYYVLFFTAALSSCAPKLDLSVTDIQVSEHKLPYKPSTLHFTYNDPESLNLSALELIKRPSPEEFDRENLYFNYVNALRKALDQAQSFGTDKVRNKDSLILVNMHPIDMPILSSTFPCKVKVDYILKSTSENKDLLQKTIETEASVPWDYHFLGAVRSTRSLELALEQNIKKYIEFLNDAADRIALESKSYQSTRNNIKSSTESDPQ